MTLSVLQILPNNPPDICTPTSHVASLAKRVMAVDVGHSGEHGSKPGKMLKGIIIGTAIGFLFVALLVLMCVGR
jgi:hypothetical protein